MESRKRTSDTTIVHSIISTDEAVFSAATKPPPAGAKTTGMEGTATTTSATNTAMTKTKLRVRFKRFHGVARWTWNAGSDDEVCGICQSAFEGVAPGIKYPGDECPVVFGKCGHAFHLQCVATWLNSSRQTCPICRAEWEYGQSTDQRRNNTETVSI